MSKSICLAVSSALESRQRKPMHLLNVLCLRFDNIAAVEPDEENDVILG